jgi:hypothetical protein
MRTVCSPLQPEAITAPQWHGVPTLENSPRPLQHARWPGSPQGDAVGGRVDASARPAETRGIGQVNDL